MAENMEPEAAPEVASEPDAEPEPAAEPESASEAEPEAEAPADAEPEPAATTPSPAAAGEAESAGKERQKWQKRMKYQLGMVYVAEFDSVPVQVSKELGSPPVCVSADGPEFRLSKDDLVQAIGMDVTAGPEGKSVPRVKIDCRSLIMLWTDAQELATEVIEGWVSVYSVEPPAEGKRRPDAILSVVPEEHIKHGVKKILQARGGYVDPQDLLKAMDVGDAIAAQTVDRELHAAMTAWHEEDLGDSHAPGSHS